MLQLMSAGIVTWVNSQCRPGTARVLGQVVKGANDELLFESGLGLKSDGASATVVILIMHRRAIWTENNLVAVNLGQSQCLGVCQISISRVSLGRIGCLSA